MFRDPCSAGAFITCHYGLQFLQYQGNITGIQSIESRDGFTPFEHGDVSPNGLAALIAEILHARVNTGLVRRFLWRCGR